MNLAHQHIGRNLVELYVLQKGAQYLLDVNVLQGRRIERQIVYSSLLILLLAAPYRIVVVVLFAPHKRRLEFGELIGSQLLPCEYQTHHMLGQQCKAAQVEHLVAMLVHKLQHLLHQRLGALVLYVTLSGCQQSAHCVHIDAALHKASTGTTQLLQAVIIGGIHDT